MEQHVPKAVTPKLPAPVPQAHGQQEHSTEAAIHCSSHLVRPVGVGRWGKGTFVVKWRWNGVGENLQGLIELSEDLCKER